MAEIMEAKKILILCHKPPYSTNDGGGIAMTQVLETLCASGHEVTLLSMETHKHPSKRNNILKDFDDNTIFVDTRIRVMGVLKNLFSDKSYILSRFDQTAFENALIKILRSKTFDSIIFESLFTSAYLKTVQKFSKAQLIYRAHNIEHHIWDSKSRISSNPLTKIYYKLQAERLKKEEMRFWASMPKIACISTDDALLIAKHTKAVVKTISLYADEQLLMQKGESSKVDFFHLGAMDWLPNQQGMDWFLDKVWPELKEKEPDAEFHLAGRGMSQKLTKRSQEGLFNHGEIFDAQQFLSEHKVMLVPLFIGSGIRVKIIEGMAMGKCIITTDIGRQAISCTHKENILIANSKSDFIDMMIFCLNNPTEVNRIGENARNFVRENFSQKHVEQELNTLLS